MPPKKNQINGFWLYAQKNKGQWKAQGLKVATNNELLSIANPLWKSLDPAQRKEWDRLAKEARQKGDGPGAVRYDNVGNIIGMRQNPAEEARKRREHDIVTVTSKWPGKDLTQERFYFINFQELVELSHSDNTEDRKFLPREMALVEYSLKQGIIQYYHQFIWPGDIPLGFRFNAEKLAEDVHRIPASKMDVDWDSDDYPKIWHKMLKVVQAGVKDGAYPPLYCLTQDYDKMKYLTDWLWAHSGDLGEESPLHWVCSIEDLVVALLAASGRPGTENVARAQVTARLDGTQWEYIPTTTCDFHKEKDVSKHCALAVVRRTAYTISDMVGMHYDISLSERHVPVRQEDDSSSVARVLPPGAVPFHSGSYRQPKRGGARGGGRGYKREEGERAGSREAGNTYRQMAKSGADTGDYGYGMAGARSGEEEEYVGQFLSQPRRMQPLDNKLRSSQSVMMQYHGSADSFPQPKPGQFDDPDWPSLAGGEVSRPAWGKPQQGFSDDDFPTALGAGGMAASEGAAVQMSNMTLADVSATLLTNEAREDTHAYPSSSGVQPPPGLSGVGRGMVWGVRPELSVGRGERPAFGRGDALPVGRGTMPTVGRGETPAAGRGMSAPAVGRGISPPSVGRGDMSAADRGNTPPPVGRGEAPYVGRGTSMPAAGRGETFGTGRAGLPVGRGQMPSSAGRGTSSPPLGRGEMPAAAAGRGGVTSVGRGWRGPASPGGDAASYPGPAPPAPGTSVTSPGRSSQQPWGATSGDSLQPAVPQAFSDDFPALGQVAGRGSNLAGRGRGFSPAGYSPS